MDAKQQAECLRACKQDLTTIKIETGNLVSEFLELKADQQKQHLAIFGNGDHIGLDEQMRELRKDFKSMIKWVKIIASILGTIATILGGALVSRHIDIIFEGGVYTAPRLVEATPATPTPLPPINTPTPAPTSVFITAQEHTALSALCWVECRGMGSHRNACCESVLSTVFERIDQEVLSDGTILGTLRWNCLPDTENCQFPAYVTHGCEGIAAPCPFDDPEGLGYFSYSVTRYANGASNPECAGYLFYDIWTIDSSACLIEGNEQRMVFHNNDRPQIESTEESEE